MIEDAQIRKVVSESEKLETAINTFKIKYGCLPGDCINWASFGFSSAYVNGNGNGVLNTTVGDGEPAGTFTHLFEAKLTPTAAPVVPIDKGPRAFYSPPGDWWIWYRPEITFYNPSTNPVTTFPSHFFVLSACLYNCWVGYIKPSTALQIDSKMDDGLPMTGKVRAYYLALDGLTWYGNATNCYDTTKTPYQYKIASTSYDCALAINANF